MLGTLGRRATAVLAFGRSALFPNAGAAFTNFAALVITCGTLLIGWEYLRPNPLVSVEVLTVTPPDGVVDRSRGGRLAIQRRVCATRSASVRLIRSWVDTTGGVMPTLDDWAWVEAGCHDRPLIYVYPPSGLAEGLHRYRTTLEWCNPLKCEEMHLEDIEVRIVGDRPPDIQTPQDRRF